MPSFWESILFPGVGHSTGSPFDSYQGLDMATYVSYPLGATNSPAIIVCQEAFGVNQHIQKVCDRLAQEGYTAVAPALFHRGQNPNPKFGYGDADAPARNRYMSNLRDDELVTDINQTIRYLQGAQGAYLRSRGQRIGIVGFCVGGRIAYLAATSCPGLSAAVVYYGGRILVPFGEGPAPVDLTRNINIPVMGNFGAKDQNPTPADVARIEGELKQHGKVYDFKMYPDAGHGFNCDERSSYHEASAKDAWQRTISWFDKYVKRGEPAQAAAARPTRRGSS
jgi:carboxymethylenebutenolidase